MIILKTFQVITKIANNITLKISLKKVICKKERLKDILISTIYKLHADLTMTDKMEIN
jgi:hypothetical protein